MTQIPYRTDLIVGAGSGISASVARQLAAAGLKVGLGVRNTAKLFELATEIGAEIFAVDAASGSDGERLFSEVDERLGEPDVVIYNASGRARGSIVDLDPGEVARAIAVSALGEFSRHARGGAADGRTGMAGLGANNHPRAGPGNGLSWSGATGRLERRKLRHYCYPPGTNKWPLSNTTRLFRTSVIVC